ncbi:MAG: helix-turn-helix domain-containing protein [Clostridia bacterium]|nr:helix-turn-helix domain-containing protein [Clostridia bacterium]
MEDIDYGEKIKELRKSKNVSQEDLAFDLDVSRQTINRWEANAQQPNMESINMLCKYFGVRHDYFFDGEEMKEEAAAAADDGGEAQTQVEAEAEDNGKIKTKRKDKRFIICLSLLVVCSVLFALLMFATAWFGFNAFSPNVGYVVVSAFDNSKIIFAICLVGSLISLGAGVILIFLLKKFKK